MRLAAILVAATLLTGACRDEGLTLISESDLPQEVYGSPGPTPTPIETPEIPEEGTVYLVRGARLWATLQPLQGVADSVAEALVLAVISPPRPVGPRITNDIPANTRLNEVRVEGVVATVDLSSDFEEAAPAPVQRLRIAQVVYTLTQDGTGIGSVRISIDGLPQPLNPEDAPVARADYRGVAPPNEGRR